MLRLHVEEAKISVSHVTVSSSNVQCDRIDQYRSAEAGIQACLATRHLQGAESVTSLSKLALPSTNAVCFHFDDENTETSKACVTGERSLNDERRGQTRDDKRPRIEQS